MPSHHTVMCVTPARIYIPCASASSHLCWPVCRRFNRLVLLLSNEHCLPSLPLSYCHPCPKFAPPIYVHLLRRAASTSIHRPPIHPSIHPVHSHHIAQIALPPSTSPSLCSPPRLDKFLYYLLPAWRLPSQPSVIPCPPRLTRRAYLLFSPIESCPLPPPHTVCLAVLLRNHHQPRFNDSTIPPASSRHPILQTLQHSIKQPDIAATYRPCVLLSICTAPINLACRPTKLLGNLRRSAANTGHFQTHHQFYLGALQLNPRRSHHCQPPPSRPSAAIQRAPCVLLDQLPAPSPSDNTTH